MGSGPATSGGREESIKEPDRQRYSGELVSLARKLSTAGAGEQAIWEVYAATEALIAVLKLRLDYERPGVFTKLPDASDPSKLVGDSPALLVRAAEQIREGKLLESIEMLRKARNNLRSYLTDKKKSTERAERKRRTKRPAR